ncbi:alpha/beta fold hydrolase [Agrococcus carbonis]|uniref:Pimeloyl-ACP methyl ester carboxylesterase n=1 Tax=Agrococcus carbonis TaxID=684552 RepID=A0A1H1MD37_9MICO|nr:alpha/beta hydrolase [Agrococcus carbonis]SDR84713.1 Pimeloyl-ACP methyl ester carboxylesterase [Agrococcus carbonis]
MTLPANLAAACRDDMRLRTAARGADVTLALADERGAQAIRVRDGEILAGGEPAFTLRLGDAEWAALLEDAPEPGWQHVLPMLRDGRARVDGDALAFDQHLHLVRRLVEALRPACAGAPRHPRPLSLRGEYVRIDGPLGTSDVYVERAGEGPQLLCLATAGSDSSQYHGLVTDTDLTDRFELVAVDLPWHGKSTPVAGVDPAGYRLDPEAYTRTIVAIADAAGLERPILVGPSMAGAAVVRAIATHPSRFRGAVSCQAGPSVRGRRTAALRSPLVNQALHVPEWTYGLMNPASPIEHRDRVWWGYSSGAFGVYEADIAGYEQWDLDEVVHLLDADSPHIAVLSGAFDTSVPPEQSRALADRIPNASFELMPELGHFPHAEDPACFARYLERGVARILSAR